MRTMTVVVMVVVLGLGAVSGARASEQQCMYASQFFASGAVACQAGVQFRCAAGSWERTGLACSDLHPGIDQPGILVDPGDQMPTPKEPAVRQPPVAVPAD